MIVFGGHMAGTTTAPTVSATGNAWSTWVRTPGMIAHCKSVAKATEVRILYPPPARSKALDQGKLWARAFFVGPARSAASGSPRLYAAGQGRRKLGPGPLSGGHGRSPGG
jgi:hypothetical protein